MTFRKDNRARLTAKIGYETPFNGKGSALRTTRGIVFPYTPDITYSQQVEYSSYEVVHQNYQQNSYSKTRNPQLQVTGQFISQTPLETEYTIGVIHFLRVVTKMNFGKDDEERGTPPPVLTFSAHGPTIFNRIPVVVSGFSMAYDNNTDYVEGVDGVQIPTVMNIAIDLLAQYSPAKHNTFNLNSFASGDLYKEGFI